MYPAPQIASCVLTYPAAIDVKDKLGAALRENGAGIDRSKGDDPPEVPMLDRIVDNSPLQLQWYDFEQEHSDGQRQETQLVPTTRLRNITVYVARHRGQRPLRRGRRYNRCVVAR